MHVFFLIFFYKYVQLNRSVLVTLHFYFHSLRCSRAVSYIELSFCMGDIAMKQAYTNSINNSNGTVLQKNY